MMYASLEGARMTLEEMSLKIIELQVSLKKANFRLYLLEKNKVFAQVAKAHKLDIEIGPMGEQLDFVDAVSS